MRTDQSASEPARKEADAGEDLSSGDSLTSTDTRSRASATHLLCVALAIVCASILDLPLAHAQGVYKYQEKGRTVYQDRAPSSRQDDGHSVLNKQGVVLKEVLSRDERRRAMKLEREKELAKIRDRALLATFTTENDLTRTRDDRIGMIDGLISRLDDRIRILSERLEIVDRRILLQEQTNGVGKAQETLYAEQLSIQRNIENAWSLIDSKAAERKEVADKFDDDLERYRELKAGIAR